MLLLWLIFFIFLCCLSLDSWFLLFLSHFLLLFGVNFLDVFVVALLLLLHLVSFFVNLSAYVGIVFIGSSAFFDKCC